MVAMEEMLPGLVPSTADRAVRYGYFINFLLLFSKPCLDSSRQSVASAGPCGREKDWVRRGH
eukprot:12962131-Ditylum_brightwellii.AAC.1